MTTQNGQPMTRGEYAEMLTEPLTEGYRPQPYVGQMWMDAGWMPQIYLLRDIEMMMTHPIVRDCLGYFKSGISGAEFWGGPDPADPDGNIGLPVCEARPDIGDFVIKLVRHFWNHGLSKVQGGYEYGWIGLENVYEESEGVLTWQGCIDFSPRDTFLLTKARRPVGVRIKNVWDKGDGNASSGQVNLWLATADVPAKALWYAHEPRYNNYYGQSQLMGAWRPWRRAGWKDSAETVLDGGCYRYLYNGPILRYPNEDLQVGPGSFPATANDSQGNPRRYSRDVARQLAEYWKTGAGIGLPSDKYSSDMGGGYKWDLELPENNVDLQPAINYILHLYDLISSGIGVPPELLKASETGSGYSGRAIPLEAFLDRQQHLAARILHMFVQQVVRPLVAWNWGLGIKFHVEPKRLLESKRKANAGNVQSPGAQSDTSSAPDELRKPGGGPGQAPGQRDQGPTQATVPPAGAPFSIAPALYTDAIRNIARKALEKARAA